MSSPPPTNPTPSSNPPLQVSSLPPPTSRFVLPPPSSDLMSRLSAFLPQIKQANDLLDQHPAAPGPEPVTLVPVKQPRPKAKAPKPDPASDSDSSASASDSSEDSSEEEEEEEEDSSEGEEIVLVNMGEDALPAGVDSLRPIVAPPSESEGEADGEGLEAGKLGLNAVPAAGKPEIVEMEQ